MRKSMLTEECDFGGFMTEHGVEIIETDLGDRIQQLDDEAPSHVVVPAVHKLRSDVARVFAEKLGSDPDTQDVHYPGRNTEGSHSASNHFRRGRYDRV
jgi:L-lactate dehydrogenase complex protein LldF